MPKGVLWLKWNFKDGVVIDWKFPENLNFDQKIISKIYSNLTFGNINIPRFATFSTEDINIASFFGGRSNTDMVLLLLENYEDIKDFEEALVTFYFNILQGRINKVTSMMQLIKHFGVKKKENEILGISDDKFNIFINLFQNFIDTIDKRLIQIEDFIIKINQFLQKLGEGL